MSERNAFEQLEYVKSLKLVFPHHFRYRKVLEVSSLDINGTVEYFDNCDYTGLDLRRQRCRSDRRRTEL